LARHRRRETEEIAIEILSKQSKASIVIVAFNSSSKQPISLDLTRKLEPEELVGSSLVHRDRNKAKQVSPSLRSTAATVYQP
jgi:hypothetical protein